MALKAVKERMGLEMKPLILIAMLIPFLTGCHATMETTMNKSATYAPVNEINGGVVQYLNQGAQWIVNRRREDAYKKMHDQCSGAYKILDEGDRMGNGSMAPVGGVLYYGQERERIIKFECVKT